MIDEAEIPEPRARDVGNGIVAYDNVYSLYVRGSFIGIEYEPALRMIDMQPAYTGHVLYVCPNCGEIWARKFLRAFPLWKPLKWIVEVAPCDSVALTLSEEALLNPNILLQALDAHLGATCKEQI